MAGGAAPPPPTTGMPGSLQPKPEDLNHPCQEQLPELKYCINDNPPWRKSLYPVLRFVIDALVLGCLKCWTYEYKMCKSLCCLPNEKRFGGCCCPRLVESHG